MLAGVVMFSIMDTTMKLLSAHYPAMQVAALRSLSSLPLVCAWLLWRGGLRSALQVRWPLHLLRAAIGIVMLALFAYGVRELSLAEAYAIFFIGPILITALSVFVLKERVNAARWIAIAVGMAGVLVILRPSGDGMLTLGGLAILASAVCYAVSAVSGRILARSDRSEHMVFWLMLMMSIGAGALAAPGWVPVQSGDLALLAVLSVSGFLAQLAITEAFNHGEASVVAPFEYTALAWGIGIDWLMWQTLPDQTTLIGAAIILGSGLYLIRHETAHVEAEHP
ncbi:DMT family transporter [Massilia phyllosphaerae]|uniref:DMT family transporter n=1 Tax=Massilia phyllosphaerae TaxID=3106034 RepID=UPI002B1CD3BC|nr:DMT family transporter [Massilia sp. SGZ-792]